MSYLKRRTANGRFLRSTLLGAAACFVMGACLFTAAPAAAVQAEEYVSDSWMTGPGTYNAQGQIVLNVYTQDQVGKRAATLNSQNLNELCDGDEPKTIVIPAGSRVELANMVYLGSNTTIIADGATIVMTSADKGIFANKPDAVNYQSISNVRIQGGNWEITDKKNSCSVMAFNHGSNVVLDNVTILSNYQSHAILGTRSR